MKIEEIKKHLEQHFLDYTFTTSKIEKNAIFVHMHKIPYLCSISTHFDGGGNIKGFFMLGRIEHSTTNIIRKHLENLLKLEKL